MKPQLLILKRRITKEHSHSNQLHFIIVDSGYHSSYPINFICVFPKSEKALREGSEYSKTFGKNSFTIARELLTQALKNENDPEIEKEIMQRLKIFAPKTTIAH